MGSALKSSCEFLDCARNEWTTVAPLNTGRRYASAATHADTIYVFGGWDAKYNYIDYVEQYDYAANKWTELQARMVVARIYASAASASGRIFIAGGMNKCYDDESSVECFDPVEKRFTNVAPHSHPRSHSAVASTRVSAIVLKRLCETVNAAS